MNVLFFSLSLVSLAFLLHLAVWRIRLPEKQTSALLMIFSVVLIFGMLFILKFPGFVKWNIAPSANVFDTMQFFLLFVSIAVSYIVSYPAIEVDSPTLVIIKAISGAGREGLETHRLGELIDDRLLILPRVNDLVSDNMIRLEDGRYKITARGAMVARIFMFYRDIVRLGKGG